MRNSSLLVTWDSAPRMPVRAFRCQPEKRIMLDGVERSDVSRSDSVS